MDVGGGTIIAIGGGFGAAMDDDEEGVAPTKIGKAIGRPRQARLPLSDGCCGSWRQPVAGASRGRESIVGPESRDRPARSRRGEAHETSDAPPLVPPSSGGKEKVPARWEERQGGDPALGGCFAWQTCTLASMMEVGGGTEDGDVGYRSDWTGPGLPLSDGSWGKKRCGRLSGTLHEALYRAVISQYNHCPRSRH